MDAARNGKQGEVIKLKLSAAKTPDALLYALSQPLPQEALSPIPGTEFTAIKDAYVKERLNTVLGPHGWDVSAPKIISLEPVKDVEGHVMTGLTGKPLWSATVALTVTIKAFKKKYHGFGGNQNEDKGDALKGAATDAFGKAISDLVGIEVYKGLVDPQNLPQTVHYSAPDAVGTSTSKNGKYVWHSGIITDKIDGRERAWFLCNGMLCYVEDNRELDKIEAAPICSKITFHATREYTKRSSVLKVVSILEVRQFDPIQIPEMK